MASYLDKTGLARFWSAIKNYISDAISGKADSEDVVQSDWYENDSTKNSYVQNRTHYRTSLGYMTDVDFIVDLGTNFEGLLAEDTYEIPPINKTYTHASNLGNSSYWYLPDHFGTNVFPTGTLDDIDIHATSTTVTLNGTEETLSIYIDDSESDNILVLYYSDNVCIVITTDYGSGLYVLEPVYTTFPEITSLILTIPLANEIFAYPKLLDSNYLDGSLIENGSGKKSEIFNGVEGKGAEGSNSHAEGSGDPLFGVLCLSGNAGETSYTAYTDLEQKYVNYLQLYFNRLTLYYNGINTGITLVSCEIQNQVEGRSDMLVTTSETLSEEEDITDKEYSILLPGLLALGDASHAEGYNTIASGHRSHAEGWSTNASSDDSHAEGNVTTASGDASHAEGSGTTASGLHSHAEGNGTTASSDCSHAEGFFTIASGNYSHVEGFLTTASGHASHAEGNGTTASSDCSHAEGRDTIASGFYSHAEGYKSTASGSYSHAENYYTTASGNYSHAEGYSTKRTDRDYYIYLTGDAGATTYTCSSTLVLSVPPSSLIGAVIGKSNTSTVTITECTVDTRGRITSVGVSESLNTSSALSNESYNIYWLNHNISEGVASHVEGRHVRAKGDASHVEGTYTYASGENSHAEGLSTAALSANQHVQGKYNIEDSAGIYADIVGNGTNSGARSNAYTLDWSGNGVFAGKVTVGAAPTNDMDVATKAYVDSHASVDTNTTYSLSINGNVITLTPSSGQAQSITLPVYDGSVT